MSLILEALRKSEANRRRGQAPDLFTELPPFAQPRGPTLSPWHWLTLAIVLFILLVWLTRERWSPSPAGVATSAAVTDMPADRTSRGQAPAEPAKAEANPTAADNGGITAPDAITAASITAPVASPATMPTPRQETAVVTSPPPPPKPLPPPAPAPAPPLAAMPVPPLPDRNGTLLQLADLSAEQRRQLPPLKLSMHLWDQDPARRFVIIDGARLGEGDRIGDAVIDRITADSVVLDWNGRRLRLSLR